MSLEEGLDPPQFKITPFEVDTNDVDTPDTMHADLGTEQPKDLLTNKDAKSPPDCSRFDSSGNLSPASSQLSSEPEERRDPENPPSTLRPPHGSQKSSWNEEEHEEEFEKELHPLPEPGSNKDLHESLMILPKPILDNQDKAKMCFFEDGPPPCSPSKVRWLKAYNRVRVQLLEVSSNSAITVLRSKTVGYKNYSDDSTNRYYSCRWCSGRHQTSIGGAERWGGTRKMRRRGVEKRAEGEHEEQEETL
ncbi:hypothetical protein CesoFtcFv8_003286 [Champsocephalus esox]|uniref:Uncharacterized protein n=1 Tax=Champsocephalus esox TaxID=159716 RepID=A0AAN8HB17_9TELE|nr:hypothetical protein CesoFtcFv8_003286 [Champsocephalus esox]